MKQTRLIMDMPITIEIVDRRVSENIISQGFDFFKYVDNKFSTYKDSSEISQINRGKLDRQNWSQDMKMIFYLSKKTKKETGGYFDITCGEISDPSGIVKGWAIYEVAKLLKKLGCKNYYIDAGGDIQASGKNRYDKPWTVGIRNPFNRDEIIKTITLKNGGIATSGTAIRGQHIYNPHKPEKKITNIVSLTVIGKTVFDADRFATAAFAMDKKGIEFIEKLSGFEGYMIDSQGIATYTSGFDNYLLQN